jgi:hypothetical protein
MFLRRLIESFDHHTVPYAIVGGFAVALHGALRGTIDIDLVINLKRQDFLKAEEALAVCGLVPKLPLKAENVFDFRQEYIRNRNLIAWSFYNPKDPSEMVDIIITHDLSRLKTITLNHQGQKIRVLAIDSLIQMKKEAGRPQDREDIKALQRIKETA